MTNMNKMNVSFGKIKSLAEKGDIEAKCILGFMYYNGYGVNANKDEAIKWFNASTWEKDLYVQFELGKNSYNPIECEDIEDYCSEEQIDGYCNTEKAEAFRWFILSALQGNEMAQYYLGVMYDFGRGVEQNLKEACYWYKLSAEQGYAAAQYELGVMYYNGYGLEQNLENAKKWFKLASVQGIVDADDYLDSIELD